MSYAISKYGIMFISINTKKMDSFIHIISYDALIQNARGKLADFHPKYKMQTFNIVYM